MSIYNIKSKEQWEKLLGDLGSESKLAVSVADENGEIRHKGGERNCLCLKIRSVQSALDHICAKSHQAIAAEAKAAKAPVVDVCEAGLAKCVIPLYDHGVWTGNISLCGCNVGEDDIDSFLIGKSVGTAEEEIEKLIEAVPTIDKDLLQKVAEGLDADLNIKD